MLPKQKRPPSLAAYRSVFNEAHLVGYSPLSALLPQIMLSAQSPLLPQIMLLAQSVLLPQMMLSLQIAENAAVVSEPQMIDEPEMPEVPHIRVLPLVQVVPEPTNWLEP